jgi:formiminotetrahydrofolate cyclodeaminase
MNKNTTIARKMSCGLDVESGMALSAAGIDAQTSNIKINNERLQSQEIKKGKEI